MSEVYVCVGRGYGWLAALQRQVVQCQYNHVFITYWSQQWNSWKAVEIDERGIIEIPAHKANERQKHVKYFSCSHDLWVGLKAMESVIGYGYDWKGVISGLGSLLLNKIGLNIEESSHSKNKMFCSEYVTHVIQKSKVKESEIFIPHQTSPKDLLIFLENSTIFKEVDCPL